MELEKSYELEKLVDENQDIQTTQLKKLRKRTILLPRKIGRPKTKNLEVNKISNNESYQFVNRNPKVQIYKGIGDNLPVTTWIDRFEMIALHLNWSENEKKIFMGDYLEDDALIWYVENAKFLDYSKLKDKMLSHFGNEIMNPMLECIQLKYDNIMGIKLYFEKKRRFGVLAKLSEEQIITCLIDGLPQKWQENFLSLRPLNYSEFYYIALKSEESFKEAQISISKHNKLKK